MEFPRFLCMLEHQARRRDQLPHWPLHLLLELGVDPLGLEEEMPRWCGEVNLDRDAIEVRRTLLFGAARAARAGLDARPHEHQGEPVCRVDSELAAAAFRGAVGAAPVRLDLALAAFMPTVIFYPEAAAGPEPGWLWVSERTGSREWLKGLVLQDGDENESRRLVLGEAHFLPPVRRSEIAARRRWVETNDIDPPLRNSLGGPYIRLGESELWRLSTLGWREQLVLAGALSTHLPVCAVVAAAGTLPQVGYVVQKLRWFGRTLVHVPWDAIPAGLRADLLAARTVRNAGAERIECGKEAS